MSASLHGSAASAGAAQDGVLRALAQGIEEASRQPGVTLLSVPAPVASSEGLLAGTTGDAVAWAAPGDFELAALGSASVLEGQGEARFRSVTGAASELFGRVRSVGLMGCAAAPARFFGGFAFRPAAPRSEWWKPFGEARFVLPEVAYLLEAGRARLLVAVVSDRCQERAEREALVDSAARALSALERGMPPIRAAAQAPVALRERSAEEWTALVEAIRSEIGRGHLEKAVLARVVAVELANEPDPALVLARLRQQAQQCTRFLVRRAGVTFLGATPELLAKKRGDALETAAVAGSMSARDREGAARLLESHKDRAEHAFVVREIVRALGPLARELEQGEPELYELRHVLHLRTQIRAKLAGRPHLLEVVERLHPTPAVGGVPTAPALEWLARHEPDERGWYAGPVGWFDAGGDGEFAVALRSGVLHGRTAHLYVGSGIVDRSAPAAELTETRWKLAALLGALGVAE